MIRFIRYIFTLLVVSVPLTLLGQTVSNVTARQVGNKIEISYSLDREANTSLLALINGKTYSCNSVSGDIGTNISSGRHVVVWDVLSDMDKLVGEISFQVSATMSSRDLQTYTARQNKEKVRSARRSRIYPFAGIDVNAGVVGFGASLYWPWKTGPSRVGSYASYVYGLTDWDDIEESGSFHNICLGMTVTLSEHVAWFVAPGLSLVNEDGKLDLSTDNYSNDSYRYSDFYSSLSSYSDELSVREYQCRFAAETGLGFRFLSFLMASVKVSYPLYVGFGLGFEFGTL